MAGEGLVGSGNVCGGEGGAHVLEGNSHHVDAAVVEGEADVVFAEGEQVAVGGCPDACACERQCQRWTCVNQLPGVVSNTGRPVCVCCLAVGGAVGARPAPTGDRVGSVRTRGQARWGGRSQGWEGVTCSLWAMGPPAFVRTSWLYDDREGGGRQADLLRVF